MHRPALVLKHSITPRRLLFQSRLLSSSAPSSPHRTALVIGSSGHLGSSVADHLASDDFSRDKISVIGADLFQNNDLHASKLDAFLPFSQDELPSAISGKILSHIGGKEHQKDTEGMRSHAPLLDVIVMAAGSWAPIHPREIDFPEHILGMYDANMLPAAVALNVASCALKDEGLVVFIGATAALVPTPTFIGYGCAKAALHHLVQSITPKSGILPRDAGAVAILPGTLNTPANVKAGMKDSDGTWVNVDDIAKQIKEWVEVPHLRPSSGSLVKVLRNKEKTVFKLVR